VGDTKPATRASFFTCGTTVDAAGNLLIGDNESNRVRAVAARTGTFYGKAMTAGHIYPIAGNGTRGFSGDGGPATGAELNAPGGVAAGPDGSLLIADTGSARVRAVTG
jgi:NHL repeat